MHRFPRVIVVSLTALLMSFLLLSPVPSMGLGPSATATTTPTQDSEPDPEPLAWPLPAPTDDQIKAAKACDLTELPKSRYPSKLKVDALAEAFTSETACDWAVLAVAYASRNEQEDTVPVAGKRALIKALSMNAALSQALPILAGYFGKVAVVEAPPFTQQPIASVKMHHTFSGLGTPPVNYTFTITKADTSAPVVTGTSLEDEVDKPITGKIDGKLVQALGAALTDLMPIRARLSLAPCWDDYPDWEVTLTFEDGTTLDLETNNSNILFSGGPWQVVINEQRYMQFSPAFLIAALQISKALNLPKDETAAMGCGGVPDTLDAAYPNGNSK